jgi:hypothetical protein
MSEFLGILDSCLFSGDNDGELGSVVVETANKNNEDLLSSTMAQSGITPDNGHMVRKMIRLGLGKGVDAEERGRSDEVCYWKII